MHRPLLLRRFAPVALVAASALLLTSCGSDGDEKDTKSDSSASASAAAEGCTDFPSGKTSEAVSVTGDFGKTQTAEFEAPLEATKLERTILDEGDGDVTEPGQSVDALITIYSGKDKKVLGSQPVSLKVGEEGMIKAFLAGVDCVPLGSRVVVTDSASEMYGEQGNPQLGVSGDDTLVIVTDLIGLKKELKPAAWTGQTATVKFDAKGAPTVKLPSKKPAEDLKLEVLREGDGEVVESGDQVTVDYQGTSWDTGKVFDQSYGRAPATFGTDQVVPGFGAALVGQKVGSRVIVTIPPQYAYGEKGTGHELAGQTLVFVIEIKETAAG